MQIQDYPFETKPLVDCLETQETSPNHKYKIKFTFTEKQMVYKCSVDCSASLVSELQGMWNNQENDMNRDKLFNFLLERLTQESSDSINQLQYSKKPQMSIISTPIP